MSRDWQKDMELLKSASEEDNHVNAEIPMYWLQQYAEWKAKAYEAEVKAAAEKERADIAELAYQGIAESAVTLGEYQSLLDKHSLLSKAYRAQRDYLNKLEAREQKLREALETIMEHSKQDGESFHLDRCYVEARDVLSSLYPKEEETK